MGANAPAERKVVLVEIRELDDQPHPCEVCRALLRWATTPRAKPLPLEVDAKVVEKEGKLFIDQDRVHFARCRGGRRPAAATSSAEERVRQLEHQLKDLRELVDESVPSRTFRRVREEATAAQEQLKTQLYRNRCLREVIDEARRRIAAGEANAAVTKWIDEAVQLAERGLSPLGTGRT